MSDSQHRKAVPEHYRRVESTELHPPPGSRFLREVDSAETITVVICLKRSVGRSGLDRIVAFAHDLGLVLVGASLENNCVVLWGTAAQMSDAFAVLLLIYETDAGTWRGWDGHVHLPGALAEIVERVIGLTEREIEDLERWLGADGFEGESGFEGSGKRIPIIFDLFVPPSGPSGAFDAGAFRLVQEFDVGWFLDPGYQRLLDNMAASPSAFQTVRVMKVFTSGATPETGIEGTQTGGTVWAAGAPSSAIDFTVTLEALTELTSRGLVPFIVLGFFPDGIYNDTSYALPGASLPGPTGPSSLPPNDDAILASDWTKIKENWTTLVQAFFEALVAKFTADIIVNWWFEVWNEPDMSTFWGPDAGSGELTYYQDLYGATSAAVTSGGYNIRLGGPAITGTSVTGTSMTSTMSQFIQYVKTNGLQCKFLSFHGKGSWSDCLNGAPYDQNGQPVVNGAPTLQSAIFAADQTALFAKASGLTSITVINDEADMRVFSDVPFLPRMTNQFPAWLMALAIAYDTLAFDYSSSGIQFMAGSDNAELQLVGWTQQNQSAVPQFAQAAFGQQRSIMTAASTGGVTSTSWVQGTCPTDLLKVPVWNFYELLPLFGDRHGAFITGSKNYYPYTNLFHMITVSATHIGSVFCVYPPNPPSGPDQTPWPLNYSIVGIPWATVNWYLFQIDANISNGFTIANGIPAIEPVVAVCTPDASGPFPVTWVPITGRDALDAADVRQHQELGVGAQGIQTLTGGKFVAPSVSVPAYTTVVFWITENTDVVPAAPVWSGSSPLAVDVTPTGKNVVLSWQASTDPTFYSYEVSKDQETVVSPSPLRAALWVDTGLTPGNTFTYWVRTVSASGVRSAWSPPMAVSI